MKLLACSFLSLDEWVSDCCVKDFLLILKKKARLLGRTVRKSFHECLIFLPINLGYPVKKCRFEFQMMMVI